MNNYFQMKQGTIFKIVGGFFLLSGIVLMIVLLALTVNQKVGQDEYGIRYNRYTMHLDNQVYTQGSFTIGVGDRFIKFKRTLQNLDIGDIFCMSHDKIILELDVAIQYELDQHSLISFILKQYGDIDTYIYFLQQVAKSTISNVCTGFDAEQYYNQRSLIDQAMFNQLRVDINDTIGATIEFFQLVNIVFPEQYAAIIVEKQNIQQNINTALNQRDSSIISANTTLFQAQLNAEAIVTNANYTASVNLNRAFAFQNITITQWNQRASAFRSIKDRLNLNQTEFIGYLESELMRSAIGSYIQLPGV